MVDVVRPNKKKLVRFLNSHSSDLYNAKLHPFTDLFFEIKTGKVKIKVKNTDITNFVLVFLVFNDKLWQKKGLTSFSQTFYFLILM